MDRMEADAVADSAGYVHIHVGAPGAKVHWVAEVVPEKSQRERLLALYGVLADDDSFEAPARSLPEEIEGL